MRCPNLDGSFDDFGIYNLVDENGYIDPYAFCWLCMDDNLIEVARHPKEILKIKVDKMLYKNDLLRIKRFDKKDFI